MTTPATPEGLDRTRWLPWALNSPKVQEWPLLARALDRAEYEQTPPEQRRGHRRAGPMLWQERSDR